LELYTLPESKSRKRSSDKKKDTKHVVSIDHDETHVQISADLPEGTILKVTLETQREDESPVSREITTIVFERETAVVKKIGQPRASVVPRFRSSLSRAWATISKGFAAVWRQSLRQISSGARVLPSIKTKHTLTFLMGIGLIILAHYLVSEREPFFRISDLSEKVNYLFRIDVNNLENTILAIGGLFIGGILVAIAARTDHFPDFTIPAVRFNIDLIKSGLPKLVRLLLPAGLAFVFIIWQVAVGNHPGLLAPIWLVVLILVMIAVWLIDRWHKVPLSPGLQWRDYAYLGGLLLAGLVIGTYRLGQIPGSLMGDEGTFWEVAQSITIGEYKPDFFGFGVYSYPIASSIYQSSILKIMGLTLWSWRFASVLAAIAAVIPTYLLAREMFSRRVAILASGVMIATPYLISFERLGYNNTQALLPVALNLYLLYVALKRSSLFYTFSSGVVAGLGFYTYTAARLGLLVSSLLFVALIVQRLISYTRRRISSKGLEAEKDTASLGTIFILGAIFLLGLILTSAPHLVYGNVVSPDSLSHKMVESIFPNVDYALDKFTSEELFRDYPPIDIGTERLFYRPDLYARLLVRGISRSFLVFHHDDLVSEHYIDGPLAGPYAGIFYLLGLSIAIAGFRRKSLFLMSMWFIAGVLLLSGINTFPPRHQHLVAVIPATSILIALGIVMVADFFAIYFEKNQRMISASIVFVCLSFVVVTGLRNFFIDVQERYVPNFENRIAFAALELESPTQMIYVYQDPNRKDFTPWVIRRIPTNASYSTVSTEELSRLAIDPDGRYFFVFEEQSKDSVLSFLEQSLGREIEPENYLNAEGKLLGMSYRFGDTERPSLLKTTDILAARAIGIVFIAFMVVLGVRFLLVRRGIITQAPSQMKTTQTQDIPVETLEVPSEVPAERPKEVKRKRARVEPGKPTQLSDLLSRFVDATKKPIQETVLPSLGPMAVLAELAVVGVVILFFALAFLNFDTDKILSGNEFGVVTFLDHVLRNTLRRFGEFPLWNSYFRTGQPFVADPFMHIFNPFTSVPVLLLDVVNGFKIAVFLSFLIAAIGQWSLGRVLGFSRSVRLWGAVLYALNGQAAARFIQGSYLFIFGYAWLPLILTGIVMSLRTHKTRYYVLTVISLAMLFFSGNTYYSYYMAGTLILFTLFASFITNRERILGLNWGAIKPLLLIGILAIGVSAVQLLPTLEFWPHIQTPGDPLLETSQPLDEAIANWISTSRNRPEALKTLPPEEFYGYISIVPFLGAVLALGAFWQGWRRKEILSFVGLFILAIIWICVRYTPLGPIYSRTPFLYQFRYPSRYMIFGSLAVINLGGIGLTWFMNLAGRWRSKHESQSTNQLPGDASRLILTVVIVLMFFSAANVFMENQKFIVLPDRYLEADGILEWLQDYDTTPNYVSIPISAGWHVAAADFGQRYWDAWHGYNFFPPVEKMPDVRPVVAKPNYLVFGKEKTPEYPDAVAVKNIQNHTVYALQESLPYGFAVVDSILKQVEAGELKRSEVTPLEVQELGPNTLSIQAETPDEKTWIVVMTNYFPGWMVTIDRQSTDLTYIGNYLAVEATPGNHEYVFSYKPDSFQLGLVITILSILILLGLVLGDFAPQSFVDRLRHTQEIVRKFLAVEVIQRIRSMIRLGGKN
jgi:4-amino-4-deoxy-L-arabinose transferase-like glycosyltransferase